jgi:hypothetical protein
VPADGAVLFILPASHRNIFETWNGTDNNGDFVWFRVPGRSFQATLKARL